MNAPKGYHRHPNGGGLVADTATVHRTAYVSATARIGDDAIIGYDARIGYRARTAQAEEGDSPTSSPSHDKVTR